MDRRRLMRSAILVAIVAGCGTPSASPQPTAMAHASATPGLNAEPTPCTLSMPCWPTAGPIVTLPPIPTAAPDPNATPRTTANPAESMRIAIAACLLYAPGGSVLEEVAALDPDLMLWLGDNIYADTEDMTVMRSIYDSLGTNPRFAALRSSVEMMAVWDDHDYGWNNANATWIHKDAAKAEFMRFWQAPPDDPRWAEPGVYSARRFGDGDRTVQVILLDNRFNLDPWDYAGIDPTRRILGEEQWAWLRARLQEPATIRLIGSGVQVVQDYDIDEEWESWGDSPLEQARLFALVRELRVPGVVFLSGDMHFSELTRHPDDAAALGYATWDLTASGIDRIETEGVGQWINPNRVGGLLNAYRKFGMVEIDWSPDDPEIHLELHDGRTVFLDQIVRLSELQPG